MPLPERGCVGFFAEGPRWLDHGRVCGFLGRCLSTWDKDREPGKDARTVDAHRPDIRVRAQEDSIATAADSSCICRLYINKHNSFVIGSVKHGVVSGD